MERMDATLKPATKVLSGASSKTLKVKGQFTATLKYQGKEATEEVYAVKKLNRSLLGRPAIEALGLVQRVNAVQTQLDIEKQYPKLFEGLGKLEEESFCKKVPDRTLCLHHVASHRHSSATESQGRARTHGTHGSRESSTAAN